MWYVYVLECADETLYTGITTDPERRIREHNESDKGARYTRSRRPVEPVAVWACADQSEAASEEAAFKKLSRNEKLRRVELGQPLEEYRDFEGEYLEVFGAREDATEARCRPLVLVDREESTVERALRIADLVDETLARLADVVDGIPADLTEDVEVRFFVGPGTFDGHGILIDGEPRVFYDMRRVDDHFGEEGFMPEVHAAHETAHAIHYGTRPDFYPGRDKSPRAEVWHRLVAEGLATRVAEAVTDCSPREALWFGVVGDEKFDEWRTEAETRREELWARVREVDESPGFDSETWTKLFRGQDDPSTIRFGYWYGREIVRRAQGDLSLTELLSAPADAWYGYVEGYFGE